MDVPTSSYRSSLFVFHSFRMKHLMSFLVLCCLVPTLEAQSPLPCNPKAVYAVDDYALSQLKGKLPQPDVKPEYEGGAAALTTHFEQLEYPSEANVQCAVAVLLNCKAQVCSCLLLSKHKEEEQFIADVLLAQAQSLPPKWLPAKVKGRFVDGYAVVLLKLENGRIAAKLK